MNPSAMPRFRVPAMVQSPLTRERLDIRNESPDQPQVRALLQALDDYLGSLYAPHDNHILSVDELLSPQVCFLVARSESRAVGCGAFRRMPGEAATAGQAYGEIKRMMVEPAARGNGIGAALLARLEQQLLDHGPRRGAAGNRRRAGAGGGLVRTLRLSAPRGLRRLPGQRAVAVL